MQFLLNVPTINFFLHQKPTSFVWDNRDDFLHNVYTCCMTKEFSCRWDIRQADSCRDSSLTSSMLISMKTFRNSHTSIVELPTPFFLALIHELCWCRSLWYHKIRSEFEMEQFPHLQNEHRYVASFFSYSISLCKICSLPFLRYISNRTCLSQWAMVW